MCRNRRGQDVIDATGAESVASKKEQAMQYLLMIYTDEAKALPADHAAPHKISPGYVAYIEAMQKAGVLVSGQRLLPSTMASSVRMVDSKVQVLDGPYAETKEQIGGFFAIEVPDLDAALAWARRCPASENGVVEVRPIWREQ
jgi:hypothetical protein